MREPRMVDDISFESYYGRQVIKTPTWKTPDVPLYLFLGGLAGGSAVLAEGATWAKKPALRRATRLTAAGGAAVGTVFLIHDLGRPERFLNMLRVFKPTSPLSVGSFILAPFAGLATAAAGSQVTGWFPRLGRLAGAGAAVFGTGLATYTGALLTNTAVPVWHDAHREMPFLFAGSAASASGGMAMITTPVAQAGPARRMAVAGAALELGTEVIMERRLGELISEPYRTGRSGTLFKAARALTAAGGATALFAKRSRTLSVVSGLASVAGSVLTRFAVFEAGIASAKDPKYTVIPQRERADRKAAERTATADPGTPAAPTEQPQPDRHAG